MSPRNRRLASFSLLLGLALAMVGQYYLAKRRDYMWDGVLFYGLASALFLAAVRLAGLGLSPSAAPAKPRWWVALGWVRGHPWRSLMVGLSFAATVGAGGRSGASLTASQGLLLLGLWSGGILLYIGATLNLGAMRARLKARVARLCASPWEPLLVALLTLVAAAARLTSLGSIPFVLGGDEASMGLQGLAVLDGRLTDPFATGWFSHPTLFAYVLAGALRWTGNTVAGLRLMPALAGTLTVPALYLLARELFDRRVAFVSAAYLAAYHFAIHYSRLGYNNIFDPLLAVLLAYSLFLGLRNRRPECFALSGVALGLGQYFYTGSRVMPLVLLGLLAWLAWREPGFWDTHRRNLAILAGGVLVAGWPLFRFFAQHPHDFMARATQLGILQSGWLVRASEFFQRSQASLLWEQFLKSALAFHYFPDPMFHYHPGIPLLDAVSAVPFTFGFVYSAARLQERRHVLLVLWLGAVLIFGGMLLEDPPSSQRLVLTTIPSSIFVALGLSLAVEVAARTWRWRAVSTWMVLGLAVAALGTINLRFYFGSYTPSRVYGGLNTEVAHAMGLYLRPKGPEYRYYLFGAPRMYASFATISYLAPAVEGEDVLEPLSGPPAFVRPDKRPLFLFLPERLGELEAVRLAYPAGQLREFRRPSRELLFAAYEPREVPDGSDQ